MKITTAFAALVIALSCWFAAKCLLVSSPDLDKTTTAVESATKAIGATVSEPERLTEIPHNPGATDSDTKIPDVSRALATPGHVMINVSDIEGHGISGAQVVVISEYAAERIDIGAIHDFSDIRASFSSSTFVTSENGNFSMLREAAGQLIVVRGADYAPQTRWLPADDPTERLQIQLTNGVSIKVLVVNGKTDDAVVGAHVLATPFGSIGRSYSDRLALIERISCGKDGTTDPNGIVVVKGLGLQRIEFTCRKEEFPAAHVFTEPGDREIVIRLHDSTICAGLVIDENHNPVEGASIRAMLQGQLPTLVEDPVFTDASGEFMLPEAPTGAISISVVKSGYAIEKRRLNLSSERVEGLEFILVAEAEFRGVVVDDRGVPVVGANVQVYDEDVEADVGNFVTLADGSWWMHWVGKGRKLSIVTDLEGHQSAIVQCVAGESSNIRIVLPRLSGLSGQVTRTDGQPVGVFSVRCISLNYGLGDERACLADELEIVVKAVDGRFSVDQLWPGKTSVLIDAGGFESWESTVDLIPGVTIQCGAVLSGTGILSGRVRSEDGSGIAAVTVALALSDDVGVIVGSRRSIGVVTDAAGTFTLPTRPQSSFALIIEEPAHGRMLVRDLVPAEFPREIVLPEPGAIEGVATCPWRSPDTVLSVRSALLGTAMYVDASVDHGGGFRFDPVAPGRYVVELVDLWASAQLDGDGVIRAIVDVRSRETTTVELSSESAGAVTGRVRGAATADARRLRVLARSHGGVVDGAEAIVADCETDADGFYALFGLPFGEFEIGVNSWQRGRLVSAWREVKLSESSPRATLDVELPRGGITGRVSADGCALPDAMVTLVREPGFETCTEGRVDAFGQFEIALVDAGEFRLRATAPGKADHLSAPFRFDPADPPSSQELKLAPESRLEVKVVDERGDPVATAEVVVDVPGLRPMVRAEPVPLDPRAQGRRVRLPAGTVLVSARAVSHVPVVERSVSLASGETRRIDLVLERAASLLVSVVDPKTGPVAGASVTIVGAAGRDLVTLMSDAVGRARFTELVPGSWLASVGTGAALPVELAPGDAKSIEIAPQRE